jgi:hypothetical protein
MLPRKKYATMMPKKKTVAAPPDELTEAWLAAGRTLKALEKAGFRRLRLGERDEMSRMWVREGSRSHALTTAEALVAVSLDKKPRRRKKC